MAHGAWDGERCPDCGWNQLDVELYTRNPDECPPVDLCCCVEIPSGYEPYWAFCNESDGHSGDHCYTWWEIYTGRNGGRFEEKVCWS